MKRKQDPHIELRLWASELKVYSPIGVYCLIILVTGIVLLKTL